MSTRRYVIILVALILLVCMVTSQASAQNDLNPIQQGDMIRQQGEQQLKNNDLQSAITSFQLALSMYSQIAIPANNKQFRIGIQTRTSRTLVLMAAIYQKSGDYTKSKNYAEQALSLGKQTNDPYIIEAATQILANFNTKKKPVLQPQPQFQPQYDSKIPQQAKDFCKALADINYDTYHNPILAQGEYDNCLWPYIQRQMDSGIAEIQEMMRPDYAAGGSQSQSPKPLQSAPQQLQQSSPTPIPFDLNNPLDGLPILPGVGSPPPSRLPSPSPSSKFECEKCQRNLRDCWERQKEMKGAVTSSSMAGTCSSWENTCSRICN